MLERFFEEMRMRARSVTDDVADRVERRVRKLIGFIIWVYMIVLPIWFISIFFLFFALFFHFAQNYQVAWDALYTGLVGIGVSLLMILVLMVGVKRR